MRAHDKKFLEYDKAEMSTENFEQIFPTLSESDRALFQLIMPMDKQKRAVNDPEQDRARHNARRTRCSAEAPHPFRIEETLDEDELYERVDAKARAIFETMPGVKDVATKRKRVTLGVVFWAEYYEHKYTAEQQEQQRQWEYSEKVKALQNKRAFLVKRAEDDVKQEIIEAKKALVEEQKMAKTKRAQEAVKYPEWYQAADELDQMQTSGTTSTSW